MHIQPFRPSSPITKPRVPATDHIVQFYEDEDFLVERVVDFLNKGFGAGQPAVVIATEAHAGKFRDGLRANGLDVDAAVKGGLLTILDAGATLDSFMTGALPDEELFVSIVGGVIETASARRPGRGVRAYGEMVNVLWNDGNPEAAIRLEQFWNTLLQTYDCSLMCAYGMRNFLHDADGEGLLEVCQQHGHVIPAEGYTWAGSEETRLREITRLQQRAQALETELDRRRELEQALSAALVREQSARADAETASRSKDDFLAVLSHELRTPLNAILGWTQIVDARRTHKDTVSRALEVIGRNAKQQMRLIDDLLDVSRIVSGKMQIAADPVDLTTTIGAAVETVGPAAASKGVEIDVMIDRTARLVTGDADRLQQVVWNLLSNAVKFTPKGGRVEVRLERVNGDAQIVVRDTGPGITPAFLPHVFDRFRQADTSITRRHGGLGLAVVRYLVEAHGGTATAESAGDGSGATFRVRLPLRPATPNIAIVSRPSPAALPPETRVLIVDDERDARELLQYILGQAGATVDVVGSAGEALKMVSAHPYDVVLTDIGMPDCDGYELIAALRALAHPKTPNLRAVAVTAYAGDYHRLRALAAGYDDYLTKPVDPERLSGVISDLVAKKAAC